MKNNNNDFGFNDDSGLMDDFKKINRNIEGSNPIDESSIPTKSEIKTINKQIRLSVKDVDILTKHFNEKGLKFSTGVRMILLQYISQNF